MRLNVGCGNHRAPRPWLNIDSYAGRGVRPDVQASACSLPFGDGSAVAVYCGHVLEHLSLDAEVPQALAEVRRVLSGAGQACFVGPDCDRADADEQWEGLRQVMRFGSERWPGDRHLWRSTATAVLDAVRAVFPDAVEVAVGELDRFWPLVGDSGWQFAVVAG